MILRAILTRGLRDSPDVVVECRRCGTTVTHDTAECPACEGVDFSRYDIPA